MPNEIGARVRYGEAFWRAHHEAWQQSALNQREYCEAQRIPLKAFGNWRARFKAEPQLPVRKLLYRRAGLSHRLSHRLSHSLSNMTYGSVSPGPIVPPPREGSRRKFNEADRPRSVRGFRRRFVFFGSDQYGYHFRSHTRESIVDSGLGGCRRLGAFF